jgi:two-component system KDP operon response regulator KdpE
VAEAPRRLLVVEDEPANRALLRAVLARSRDERLGRPELLEAGSIAEARQILGEREIDLILLDVRLPDGSGLELATELRDAGAAKPRVVILSASVLPSERGAALEAGADAFLGKPYAPSELVETILGVLERAGS